MGQRHVDLRARRSPLRPRAYPGRFRLLGTDVLGGPHKGSPSSLCHGKLPKAWSSPFTCPRSNRKDKHRTPIVKR